VGDLDGTLGIADRRIEEETELQIVAVVRHRYPPQIPLSAASVPVPRS
jgi:hypothetical protein